MGIQTDTHPKVTSKTNPAQAQPMAMSIQNVSKQFNNKSWGSRDFTLELGPGVLDLLDPNGAGKSTLMHILATVTKASSGTAHGTVRTSPNRPTNCATYWDTYRRISACTRI